MASNPSADIDELIEQAKCFDYVRFTVYDINGIARAKAVPARKVKKFLKNGLSFWSGAIALGPVGEIPLGISSEDRDVESGTNLIASPVCESISTLPWAADGKFKVGEILCEPRWHDGVFQDSNPRYVARKQLNVLKSMGLRLYSSYEIECYILDSKTKQPITETDQLLASLPFVNHESLLFDMESKLYTYGVDLQTLECEGSPGQFEFTLEPSYGIDCPDMAVKFKTAMKEICVQNGYHVTFMSKPLVGHYSSGLHFSHSLWDINTDRNVFYDATKEDQLSDTARYFIGGIMTHTKAITALLCPSSNCYRRINCPGVIPTKIDWGIDNRFSMLRVKNTSEEGTYLENRLPSGSCNPYIAQAATIAAGIDGINNKTEPPSKCMKGWKKSPDSENLPQTLSEAISALEQDTVITEALGKEFVQWFVHCKKMFDVSKFESHDFKSDSVEEVEKERLVYYHLM